MNKNQTPNIKYNLDANAGLIIQPDDLQYFINIESTINNINGWSQDKINIRNDYALVRNKLLQTFINNEDQPQFSNIYYSFSVSNAVHQLHTAINNKNEDIFLYPNHHPRIEKIFTVNNTTVNNNTFTGKQQRKQKVCLINMLTSEQNIDQSEQIKDVEERGFLYTIVDASQALGRLNLQQHLSNIDCLLISPRKVGGMSNLCFVFVTQQFDQKYLSPTGNDQDQHYFLPQTRFISYILASARPVIDNFTPFEYNKEANKQQYDALIQQLSQFKEDITVQLVNEGTPQTYTSLIIELEKSLCPKLFQQELAKRGISVGFETSCQSNTSNKIRFSWRNIYSEIDITDEIDQAIQACKEDRMNEDTDQQENIIKGGSYKLKIQQDKQYNPSQGKQNINMFNRRLFYLRGHWVPLNTDDNEASRLKITSKYAVMFQNFVLQQHQDYYLYIPELKDEFKKWCQNKMEQNYKLENIHNLQADHNLEPSQSLNTDDEKENDLSEFEYLYRVSKHIYLTPFNKQSSDVSKTILTLSDFDFDDQEQRYPKLPDDFVQLFQNPNADNTNNENTNNENGNENQILYPMTYSKYKKCLKEKINLQKEYINNPLSEFVVKLKLPIQEHYINSSNSYKHVIRQSLVLNADDEDKTTDNEQPINTRFIQVIQPAKSYLNETAIDKATTMTKQNNKTKIILILHNPSVEQQDKIFQMGFEEVRNKILSYQNWYQQWYYDDNIYTYTKNIKKY